ncbi:MAG: flagellar L-ring protein precursor FlgH [Planctomycetota bacterium]|jgi:flagellar L-ring protein precursor FlgH
MRENTALGALIKIVIVIGFLCGIATAQSLWDPSYATRPLFADNTARGVGDILTIVIEENSKVVNDEETQITKDSSLDAALTNFDILPNLWEPLPAASGSSSTSFDGAGTYDKDNSFETTISVIVIDTMPNGNMLVEGTRSIVIDGDTKIVKITGMIRAFDVTKANEVSSNRVANVRISYKGTGPLNRATNRGWFSRMLDIVWPF